MIIARITTESGHVVTLETSARETPVAFVITERFESQGSETYSLDSFSTLNEAILRFGFWVMNAAMTDDCPRKGNKVLTNAPP